MERIVITFTNTTYDKVRINYTYNVNNCTLFNNKTIIIMHVVNTVLNMNITKKN